MTLDRETTADDVPRSLDMKRHKFARDIKAAYYEKDFRGRAKMLAQLIKLGWRLGSQEPVSSPWAVRIMPPLLAVLAFGLYALGGAKLAGPGVILGYLLASQFIFRPHVRRARDEYEELEERLFDRARDEFLPDRTESKQGP